MNENTVDVKALANEVKQAISQLKVAGEQERSGVVTRVGDGIAWIFGLSQCGYSEMLDIQTSSGVQSAFTLNLLEDEVGAVLLGDDRSVKAGDKVSLTGRILSVPTGKELLGRVVDPLGRVLDGGIEPKTSSRGDVEAPAPGVIDRVSVFEPLATGITAIDAMVPIGRGQRELVIGDRQTGKTALCIDTMINQAKQKTGIVSIYVAIGQKNSKVARVIERLKREDVLDQTVIVSASASDPASLQYLAPFAATAIGEWFRDNGQHALIIYDDLSKHAVAYRQMSLLLRKPPGREAYPGDVFYLHSRLLERSAKLSEKNGGGSLTSLPIIETQAGEVSAYIPTNVISITDGQIYLESDLFYQGIRPAISVGLSVSRVGGAAQPKPIKSVAGSLRLDLAQFRELAAFSQFSSDLDKRTQDQILRGRLLTEVLKQPQFSPLAVWEQAAVILASTKGAFDKVPVDKVAAVKKELLRNISTHHKDVVAQLSKDQKISEPVEKSILELAKKTAKSYEKVENN